MPRPSVVEALRPTVKNLPAGSFAFVMATGIVSTALSDIGWALPSLILLILAILGLIVLAAATVWRAASFGPDVLAEARDPGRAFGFFTIVAALNVVGLRLYATGLPAITIALALLSVPVWIVLTYGLPANLMLGPKRDPAISPADGSWFLWVVGTQSLAVAAATLDGGVNPVLALIAVALWGVGVVLYVVLAALVTLRLLTVAAKPTSLSQSYWVYMGATAITVLAGSAVVDLPSGLPVLRVTAPAVLGLSFMLWAFGGWLVPLLLVFGFWRHIVHREPVRYGAGLWSIVFPLGMYSVASMQFGAAARLPVLVTVGRVGTCIAGLAWLAVTLAMIGAAADRLRPGRRLRRTGQ